MSQSDDCILKLFLAFWSFFSAFLTELQQHLKLNHHMANSCLLNQLKKNKYDYKWENMKMFYL